MRQTQRWIWIGLLAAMVALVACGSAAEESSSGGEAGTIPDEISCEVFYRPSANAPLSESTLALSTSGGQGATTASAAFEDLAAEATFLSDAGEGQSLSIVVTDVTTGAELARALYQFHPQAGVTDQFIGGHGFTGLAYVYHPTSDSEVQYFCAGGG